MHTHTAPYWTELLQLARHPEGGWFRETYRSAEKVAGSGDFALVGCTVAPGFDVNDFESGNERDLAELFPQHEALIGRLTRG
ncbi:hypothetical protein F6V30_02340 [Oryzomonas sagensis]|uniref:DUF985 domain-containing protein n=1 Tax=Oryzomonas sagensis TaxID=2603857 RepID=A0ABQ6TR20_9BACT|nr:cupin domain-containing protein [Oryzomonas sagensis]KAB0671438.1 hypothetical protein F6V30_02340 [Oryzomonas sagensis]